MIDRSEKAFERLLKYARRELAPDLDMLDGGERIEGGGYSICRQASDPADSIFVGDVDLRWDSASLGEVVIFPFQNRHRSVRKLPGAKDCLLEKYAYIEDIDILDEHDHDAHALDISIDKKAFAEHPEEGEPFGILDAVDRLKKKACDLAHSQVSRECLYARPVYV